jgi:hypothetical protein
MQLCADESMSSMMLIKLGILTKAYQMAEQVPSNLDASVT